VSNLTTSKKVNHRAKSKNVNRGLLSDGVTSAKLSIAL